MANLLDKNSNEVMILRALESKPKTRLDLLEELSWPSTTFQYTISKLNGFIEITKEKKSKVKRKFIYQLNEAGKVLCKAIKLTD